MVIATGGRPAPEIAGQPPDRVVGEGGGVELSEEFGVIDRVEGLREIYRRGHCSMGGGDAC